MVFENSFQPQQRLKVRHRKFRETALIYNFFFRTETGKYASYCSRALERAVANGPRQSKPSRMEVLSILLKNPHHHSLPHAVPVHCANDTYQVVGFDGSTTVAEFLAELCRLLGTRPLEQSGFTIHSDDPIEKNLLHALHTEEKVKMFTQLHWKKFNMSFD